MQFDFGNDDIPDIWGSICGGEGENDRKKDRKVYKRPPGKNTRIREKMVCSRQKPETNKFAKEDQKPETEQINRYKR